VSSNWVRRDAQPYEPGNLAALKHGMYSERMVDPIAVMFIESVVARRPDLLSHPEALHAWARAEARALMLAEYVCEVGIGSDAAQRAMRYESQFQRLALSLRQSLGLDPKSEAELVNAQADAARQVVDLDAIRARGRAVIEANRKGKR